MPRDFGLTAEALMRRGCDGGTLGRKGLVWCPIRGRLSVDIAEDLRKERVEPRGLLEANHDIVEAATFGDL